MNMKEFCRQYAVTKDVIKAFLHAGLLKGFEDDLERDFQAFDQSSCGRHIG